jgi:hypothetical protein
MNSRELVESTFAACKDKLVKRQMCYLLARHGFRFLCLNDENMDT